MDYLDSNPAPSPAARPAGGPGSRSEALEATGFARALGIGDMHVVADDCQAALESYERALAIVAEQPAWRRERAEVRLRIAECYRRRGEFHEAAAELSRIRSEIDPLIDADIAAKVIGRTGMVQQSIGDYLIARKNCEEAYATLRGGSDNEEIGLLELALGSIASRLGEIDRAHEYFESALFTFRRIDHREGIARSLNNLGLLLTPTPHWREAQEHLERALAVSEEAGNATRVASHCLNLGVLLTKRCEWTQALQHLSRALATFRELDNTDKLTKTLLAIGNLKLRLGQLRIAGTHYGQALDLATRNGYRREEVLALEFLGELALREGRFSAARDHLGKALKKAESFAPEGDLVAECKRRLAEEAFARGDASAAIRWATEAAWIAGQITDHCELGSCLRILGEAAWLTGRPDAALRHLSGAVEELDRTPAVFEDTVARLRYSAILIASHQQSNEEGAARIALEVLEPIWDRLRTLDIDALAPDFVEAHARALVATGDLEAALRSVDRGISLLETHGLVAARRRLAELRVELAENQIERILSATEEYRILQECGPLDASGARDGRGTHRLLRQMVQHLGLRRALVAHGPSWEHLEVEESIGLDRPVAMLRALGPVLNAFAAGRTIWLASNGEESQRIGSGVSRWRQEGPMVALRLRPGEDMWGILVAERERGAEAFRTQDLRILSLFGSLVSVFMEVRRQSETASTDGVVPDISGDSFAAFQTVDPSTREIIRLLRRIATSDASVLITGETGTGKGLLAQCIHRASRRREKNFIQVNCAALPESLLESELFGHVQGAFTGAVRNKRGLIEEADGGTLFLDEVDRCHRNVQAKLLHVLDSREFRPVGDVRSRTVDVRIICATNTDLATAIQSGVFLEDLFYRLNDFQVAIPPLRERREDIPVLVRHFFAVCVRELGRRPAGISREALQRLMDHDWRGNVRELSKCIRRLVVLSEDAEWIGPEVLPPELREGIGVAQGGPTLRDAIHRLEAGLIGRTLRDTDWNKSETSRRLRLSYPALLAKIRLYGLEPGGPRKNPSYGSKKPQ